MMKNTTQQRQSSRRQQVRRLQRLRERFATPKPRRVIFYYEAGYSLAEATRFEEMEREVQMMERLKAAGAELSEEDEWRADQMHAEIEVARERAAEAITHQARAELAAQSRRSR